MIHSNVPISTPSSTIRSDRVPQYIGPSHQLTTSNEPLLTQAHSEFFVARMNQPYWLDGRWRDAVVPESVLRHAKPASEQETFRKRANDQAYFGKHTWPVRTWYGDAFDTLTQPVRILGQAWQGAKNFVSPVTEPLARLVGGVIGFPGRIKERSQRNVITNVLFKVSPLILSAGIGFYNTEQVAGEVASEVAEQQSIRPIDDAVKNRAIHNPIRIKDNDDNTMDWTEAFQMIQKYGHDREITEALIPQILGRASTPEGYLYLNHMLLETFENMPQLDSKTRLHYQKILKEEWSGEGARDRGEEFVSVRDQFRVAAQLVLIPALGEIPEFQNVTDPNGKESLYYIQKIPEAYTKDVLRFNIRLSVERDALMDLSVSHNDWVRGQLTNPSDDELDYLDSRSQVLWENYPANLNQWGDKVSMLDLYDDRLNQSFDAMMEDAVNKNPNVYKSSRNSWSAAETSVGGMVGGFASMYFLPTGGLIKSTVAFLVYGAAGSYATNSFSLKEPVLDRSLIQRCNPVYGALCEAPIE